MSDGAGDILVDEVMSVVVVGTLAVHIERTSVFRIDEAWREERVRIVGLALPLGHFRIRKPLGLKEIDSRRDAGHETHVPGETIVAHHLADHGHGGAGVDSARLIRAGVRRLEVSHGVLVRPAGIRSALLKKDSAVHGPVDRLLEARDAE